MGNGKAVGTIAGAVVGKAVGVIAGIVVGKGVGATVVAVAGKSVGKGMDAVVGKVVGKALTMVGVGGAMFVVAVAITRVIGEGTPCAGAVVATGVAVNGGKDAASVETGATTVATPVGSVAVGFTSATLVGVAS